MVNDTFRAIFGSSSPNNAPPPSNDPAETLPRQGKRITRQENLFPIFVSPSKNTQAPPQMIVQNFFPRQGIFNPR